jgi:hypothetical protein
MNKYKTWQQMEDDRIIKEAEMKRKKEEESKDKLVEGLKNEGGIKEAAAVFSYEGFSWMMNMMGDLIADKIEPMIDRKIMEVFDGMKEGLLQAVADASKKKIENIFVEKVEQKLNFGTSDEVEQPETTEDEIVAENLFPHANSDFSVLDGKLGDTMSIKPVIVGERSRNDSWTDEEDEELKNVILNTMKEGGSQTSAFKKFSHIYPARTESAAGFRWSHTLRKDLKEEIAEAKALGKIAKATKK